MYAVFQSGGKQYKATLGQILEVDNLALKQNDSVTFDKVLLLVADADVKVGTPFLNEFPIKAKVLNQQKGNKIRVTKFKGKVRFRRVTGFRAQMTRIQIEQIGTHKTEKAAPAEKKEVKEPQKEALKPVKPAQKKT